MSFRAGVARVFAVTLAAIFLSGHVHAQDQVAADRYELQAGDKIFIQVFDEPDLTMEATVGQSGAINYSYLCLLYTSDAADE